MDKNEVDKYVRINFCNNQDYKHKLYKYYSLDSNENVDVDDVEKIETKDLIKDTK